MTSHLIKMGDDYPQSTIEKSFGIRPIVPYKLVYTCDICLTSYPTKQHIRSYTCPICHQKMNICDNCPSPRLGSECVKCLTDNI